MPDLPRQYDEPDLATHVCNVLDDYDAGLLDGRDEAVEAIIGHPVIQQAIRMKVIDHL